jgi:hypothetical protein
MARSRQEMVTDERDTRVNKSVKNGSKTAVMDVIGFLCAALGSSTVQHHDNLGGRRACACSEAGFSSQNGNHA